MTRDELVRAACRGDARSRNALGPWLNHQLQQFFANVRADLESTDEIRQDTLVELWAKLPEKNPTSAAELVSLLYRFAVICSRRARTSDARRHKRQTELEQVPERDPTRSPATKIAQRQIAERCLDELATPVREIMRWAMDGGTLRAFAAEKGIPEGTVRRHHQKGLNQLRELLIREGVTPSQCGL